MTMRIAALVMFAFASASVATAIPAAGQTIVIEPPRPRVEVVPAHRAGYVWSGGHWGWRQGKYEWIGGHWIAERAGYHYVAGGWRHGPHGWVWTEERWVR